MYVWVAVSKDEYELPEIVADSAAEMARKAGTTKNNVQSSFSKYRKGVYKYSRFHKVEIDDD